MLDLGCGTGDLLDDVHTAGMSPAWVGVDLRPDAVAAARSQHPNHRFHIASADDVPEPDDAFDVIIAQLLFSSLPSADLSRAVVEEITRLLRPGGWLIWSDVRIGNPRNAEVHGVSDHALRRLFPRWRIEVQRAGLMPPIARRLGPIAGLAYPALAAAPWLRSHLVGRLQPPRRE